MSKESSPRGVTTKNTYTDLGATTAEAYEISRTSRALAQKEIGDADYEDRVRQRCSIAVGDFAMAGLLRFTKNPVEAGLAALSRSSPLVTISGWSSSIQKKGHSSPVLCALDYGADLPNPEITGAVPIPP